MKRDYRNEVISYYRKTYVTDREGLDTQWRESGSVNTIFTGPSGKLRYVVKQRVVRRERGCNVEHEYGPNEKIWHATASTPIKTVAERFAE